MAWFKKKVKYKVWWSNDNLRRWSELSEDYRSLGVAMKAVGKIWEERGPVPIFRIVGDDGSSYLLTRV